MQYICVSRKKAAKEFGAYSSGQEAAAAFVESTTDEEDFLDGAAFGFKQRKSDEKSNDQWKSFVCGPKPKLTRSCVNANCSSVIRQGERTEKCIDRYSHCKLTVLQRYCTLPQFQESCCQSCAH